MSDLLAFLTTHEEAFRSRARLASLYSDFRFQRTTNPDGYQANLSAWLQALSSAAKAGVIPSQNGDKFVLHAGETLASALQTPENGRPLALGAVLAEAVKSKQMVPLREFMELKQSFYARSWVPSPWQVASWGLRQIGLLGEHGGEDRLARGEFVVVANLEAAAKAVLNQASITATSNTSRVYSRELFARAFAPTLGVDQLSSNDLSVLLTHLSRDRQAIAYSPASGVVKFQSLSEGSLTPITEEDASIASMRTLIASLEPQVELLTKQIADLESKARDAVSRKQLIAAKTALRQKKAAETKLQQRSTTLAQLEDVYAKIEQAADQVEMVKVMSAAGQTLKSLNKQTGGVEKIQDVFDDLREEMLNADEIGQALNEISAGEVDEGEVEDELAALEKVEREKSEALERAERERAAAAENAQREKQEADEVEKTRLKLAELDQLGTTKEDTKEPPHSEQQAIPEALAS